MISGFGGDPYKGTDGCEDLFELGEGLSAEHGYAGLAEVGDAFEQRSRGQMTAYMEDAAIFVNATDALMDLPAQDFELIGRGEGIG